MIDEISQSTRQQKISFFAELMRGEYIFVHLDARHPEVIVPEWLKNNPALKLQLSYKFRGHIEHDELAITADLVFKGKYHSCRIPWDAVWAMIPSEGDACTWPLSIPKDLMALKEKVDDSHDRTEGKLEEAQHRNGKKKVRPVKVEIASSEKKDSKSKVKSRAHLKLVK